MMKNFWQKLPRPFLALAPMEDVTDAAFRRLIARHGKPHVMFTEFTSADGLVLAPRSGQEKLRKKLLYAENERPMVVQLFSSIPERMEKAAHIAVELGFDGIDINMGCPDRAVERGGCGAALMKNPALARALIRAAKSSGLPVSVKTRIGYTKDELETWLPGLLTEEPAAIALHARTRKEMSDVPARWERVKRAVKIRDSLGSKTLIIGNGDVRDITDAREKAAMSGADGIMLGRAIYGNPWLYNDLRSRYTPTPYERALVLMEHLELFDELLSDTTSFAIMRKHFKAYISGWNGAKELRIRLMETSTSAKAREVLAGALPERV
ncbi:TPA: tRNA-dihydrouridine synthase [Candidatus Kaiserbacteria bacterium]|nr:tRNA-dihydrouridine synthase [Candidatus Kaiserbacteria bacterium]